MDAIGTVRSSSDGVVGTGRALILDRVLTIVTLRAGMDWLVRLHTETFRADVPVGALSLGRRSSCSTVAVVVKRADSTVSSFNIRVKAFTAHLRLNHTLIRAVPSGEAWFASLVAKSNLSRCKCSVVHAFKRGHIAIIAFRAWGGSH